MSEFKNYPVVESVIDLFTRWLERRRDALATQLAARRLPLIWGCRLVNLIS